MGDIELFLILGVLAPLVGFVLLALFGARLGKPLSGWVAVLFMGVSCALAGVVLADWMGMDPAARRVASDAALTHSWLWAHMGGVPVRLGVNLDSLTVIMFFMVTFVSFWIFFFSVGYMAGHSDEVDGISKYHRFFTYLSLFGFSMLGLVISNSLLFLFIFWELVGLCSYLLIGFYFDRRYATNAAIKAFVVNRVGDFGFLIGLMMVFFYLKTFSLHEAAAAFAEQHAAGGELFTVSLWGVPLATWMGVGLFCGAIGKSAQFPLQVWLPDAMAGPTPVSALIHAATMVAAGVYLVARIYLLLTPQAQFVIAGIGVITLTITALIAMVQTDIKKVLAYSTLSQLGYMVFGMGVGAWIGALFHLLTHAFFKALMFLGSGQVIEGCHHEQDIRKMGGLARRMPITAVTFLVGVLAIAGVGFPGKNIGVGGFFSKDEILAVAYLRTHEVPEAHDAVEQRESHQNPVGEHASEASAAAGVLGAGKLPKWLWVLPLVIAYVTPFYMMRCWWLTFMGKPRDHHVHEHAHESPLMWIPLVVLAAGTFLSGYVWFRPMVADMAPGGFLAPAISGDHHGPGMHEVHAALVPAVGFAFVVGFGLAIAIYYRGLATAEKLKETFRPMHMALERKLFFDDVYNFLAVGGTILVSQISRLVDIYIVDLLVNLSAKLTERLSAASGWILDAGGLLGGHLARQFGRPVVWLLSLLGTAAIGWLTWVGDAAGAITVCVGMVFVFGIDGMVNGLASGAYDFAGAVRSPQVGRIRSYVTFAAGGAALMLLAVVYLAISNGMR